jgi:trk system potassium uptake protein TrkA
MRIHDLSRKVTPDVLICTVERDGKILIPDGNFVLQKEDSISIIAAPNRASEFFKKTSIITNRVKNVMIIGGGRITFYLARELLKRGIEVKIIERDSKKCEELSEALNQAVIINADATDQEMLLEEGIKHTEAFVALTNFYEQNILLSLYAESLSDTKLITKVNKIAFEDVVEKMKIGSIIHPK